MATTTHLFAVGRIAQGQVDILLAPARQQPVCSDSWGCHCYAYSHGYDDAKDGFLPEPLHHVSALCCIEKYMMGHRDGLRILEASRKLPATDGEQQHLIDEGEQTAEYADWLEDVEWMRQGC